jgi:hypothetical protein
MTTRRHPLFLAFLLACACLDLQAQEFTVLGGTMATTELKQSSYSWQIDYCQDFYKNLAASITYVNEGHVPGHHRDGYAVQAWGRLPTPHNRFSLALGLGAYFFYDTQALTGGGTENVHGTATIVSLAGTGYLSNRTFYRLELSHIIPVHQMQVNTATLGIGYWFGRNDKPTPGEFGHGPDDKTTITGNELTVFVGQSVVNTFFSQSARAYALEYRRGLIRHVDWTASLIYEGNPEIVRRSGLATQVWAVNHFFQDRVTVGIGLGPYIYIDRKHPADAGNINPAAITPLASLTLSEHLSGPWNLRLVVDRVTSSYNRDADIFLLGLGRVW